MKVEEEEVRLGVSLRRVDVLRKTMDTPRRALSLTVGGSPEATTELHPKTRGFVELYRELTPEMLTTIDENDEEQRDFAREMGRRVASLPSDQEIILLVLAFRQKGFCPDANAAEHLADLAAAPFVDAVAVPAIAPTDADSYFSYVKTFIDAFSRIDRTPLLGYIPMFAHRDILKTVDFYLGNDVKDFVFEFNGHHAGVLYPNVQAVNRLLRKHVGDDYFIHGLNVGAGAFRRSRETSPSKDFLALLSGIDSMGAKHVRKKMPMKVWNRLSSEREKGRRLFARYDYGYYEPAAYRREFGSRVDEGFVSSISVCRAPTASSVRLFNAERQALETANIRKRLSEGSLLEYARSKSHLREEIDHVASLWKQQTL